MDYGCYIYYTLSYSPPFYTKLPEEQHTYTQSSSTYCPLLTLAMHIRISDHKPHFLACLQTHNTKHCFVIIISHTPLTSLKFSIQIQYYTHNKIKNTQVYQLLRIYLMPHQKQTNNNKPPPWAKCITLDYHSNPKRIRNLISQRTHKEQPRKKKAGRAFLYLNKMHQWRKQQTAQCFSVIGSRFCNVLKPLKNYVYRGKYHRNIKRRISFPNYSDNG